MSDLIIAIIVAALGAATVYLISRKERVFETALASIVLLVVSVALSFLLFSLFVYEPRESRLKAEEHQLKVAERVIVPDGDALTDIDDQTLLKKGRCIAAALQDLHEAYENRVVELTNRFPETARTTDSDRERLEQLHLSEARQLFATFDDHYRSRSALVVGELVSRLPRKQRVDMHSGPILAISAVTYFLRPNNPRTNSRYVATFGMHLDSWLLTIGPDAILMIADDIETVADLFKESKAN